MPTVLLTEGFRFFSFSNERNEPPHIHVEPGDGYAKLWLAPIVLVDSVGLTRSELRRLRELTRSNERLFLERWREHFGS